MDHPGNVCKVAPRYLLIARGCVTERITWLFFDAITPL